MAWNTSTSWVTSDAPVLATVINDIGLDIRTWGGNVDAGGYYLANLERLGLTATSLIYRPADAGYEWWVMSFTDATSWQFIRRKIADGTYSTVMSLTAAGRVGIGINTPGSALGVAGLPTYADNAAALSGGLTAGDFYRTSAGAVMVTY